jgi:hypothetical protein
MGGWPVPNLRATQKACKRWLSNLPVAKRADRPAVGASDSTSSTRVPRHDSASRPLP